jgi:hypothetical protein
MRHWSKTLDLSEQSSLALNTLYKQDSSSRLAILKSMASCELPNTPLQWDLTKNIGGAMCLICLKFPLSTEESEPLIVASFLTKVSHETAPLPLIASDEQLGFCAKTLVALSLFYPAMRRRTDRHAAPSPEYYRQTSRGILQNKTPAHRALASHHVAWENFLYEQLSPSTENH